MAISTILNAEAQEFIPQNNSLLLRSHPPPFTYTNLLLPLSTPVISFYHSPPPPSPYFAPTTDCYYPYQYYSTLPRPLLNPETHRFPANYFDFHPSPPPPPPPSNPSKRLIRAQISVEFGLGLGDQKLTAGHHSRGGRHGRAPCSGRRSRHGGGGRGGDLGSRGRRSAWKEELSLLGVVNNSSSEEEYCYSVDTTTNVLKYPRIVEPREMVGKRKKPVVPVDEGGDRTTVMIRNIPNKYTYVPFFET